MLYKAKLVYSLIIFGLDDDVEIINEESLKNEDNLKNEDDLKMKMTSKMKTTSRLYIDEAHTALKIFPPAPPIRPLSS